MSGGTDYQKWDAIVADIDDSDGSASGGEDDGLDAAFAAAVTAAAAPPSLPAAPAGALAAAGQSAPPPGPPPAQSARAATPEGKDVGQGVGDAKAGEEAGSSSSRGAIHSPLIDACAMGKLALAEQLIACGSDVNEAPRGKNITPLLAATLSQHTDILNLLLRSGCQLGAVGPDGSTALHMAACAGCPNSIRWLLENGADPLAPNDFKCRPSQMISPDIEPATREEALGLLWAAEQQAGFVDPATQAPGAALGWTEEESPIMVLEVRAREAIAEGRLEEALAHYAELHTAMLQGGHASSAANALRAMAQVEIQMGHFSAASTHLQDALSVYRAAGDRQMEGHVLNEVGICRREEGDYDAALASFKSAMDACHESRDGDLLWHVHNNTGGVLLGAGKTEEGMLEFCHSLEIAIALGGDKPRGIEARAIANSRHNIGCALIKLGREEAAVEELEEALRGKTDVKDWAGMRSTLAMLAQAEGALGHVDEATEYVVTLSKLERGKMGKPPQEACLVCWGALEGRPTLEVEGGVGAKEDGLCTALGCYHVFHVHCLAAWRAKAPKSKKEAACPSCGKKAPPPGLS